MNTLSKASIKRHILCWDCRNVDIHGFCDTAGKAYRAIAFAKVSFSHGVSGNFWVGKSRLALMKKLSIPRLELLGCLLLSKHKIYVVAAVKSEVKLTNYVHLNRSSVNSVDMGATYRPWVTDT